MKIWHVPTQPTVVMALKIYELRTTTKMTIHEIATFMGKDDSYIKALFRWARDHKDGYSSDGTPKEGLSEIMASAVNGMVDQIKK